MRAGRPPGAVSSRLLFAAIAAAAVLAGAGLWWATRAPRVDASPTPVAPAALWTATFADPQGRPHALGELEGHVVVINFWVTWCAPCREEMPGFSRLAERWKARGVRFVGLANDDAAKVERFGKELAIAYPLWVGGEAVGELSRRLGNRLGVLPHTVIIDPFGRPLDARVGPYAEKDLDAKLAVIVSKSH